MKFLNNLKMLSVCVLMLCTMQSCDWMKGVLGMPTSDDIEKMKMELLQQQQREAQQAKLEAQRVQDSIKLALEAQKKAVEGYYLVMGCFKERNNAENMMKELEKLGYPAQEIELKTGYTMVGIEGYNTFNEALKDLDEVG